MAKFLVELRNPAGPRLVVFLQEAESLPDDLARGVVLLGGGALSLEPWGVAIVEQGKP